MRKGYINIRSNYKLKQTVLFHFKICKSKKTYLYQMTAQVVKISL